MALFPWLFTLGYSVHRERELIEARSADGCTCSRRGTTVNVRHFQHNLPTASANSSGYVACECNLYHHCWRIGLICPESDNFDHPSAGPARQAGIREVF